MIVDFFITIIAIILGAFAWVLSLIPFNITFATTFSTALMWLFKPALLFSGIWDINFTVNTLVVILEFEIAWWTYQILLLMTHWIRLRPAHPTK